jgi:hypothetical protein
MKTAEDTPLAALATDFGNGEVTMVCGTAARDWTAHPGALALRPAAMINRNLGDCRRA